MASRPSRYIHGTTGDEQRRLALMNGLLNRGSLAAIALRPGERVLDLGCGTGQLTRMLAAAVGPSGVVVGCDRSDEQLAAARQLVPAGGEEPASAAIDWRRGEAGGWPIAAAERGSFDVVHARFLLEHLPDPVAAVAEMMSLVRPGGRVVLEDDDHDLLRLHPEPPGVSAAWAAYLRSYDRNGNDPYVGRRLVSLLHGAGARLRHTTWIYFGAASGEEHFAACCANLAAILAGARTAILATGFDPAGLDAALAAIDDFAARPDAVFGYAIPWAEGERPASG